MTSVRGAGYTSVSSTTAKSVFDPFQQGGSVNKRSSCASYHCLISVKGPAPPLQKQSDTSPEFMGREMEKEVNALLVTPIKIFAFATPLN